MVKLFSRFFDNRSGATAIQFGFIAVGIVIVMIAVVSEFEPKLNTDIFHHSIGLVAC